MYTLAVDFGTTFTAAAVLGENGVPEVVGLGNRAMQVPSTVFVADDGSVLVGEAAERAALADPSRARREIKRRIGDDIPILVGGSPYSVGSLAGRVIGWVIDRCRERYGEPPTDLVLTHPAGWRQFKIDVLRQAAAQAGYPDVTFGPEPVAAAMFYAARSRVDVGRRLCVYDLGGGTFDVCVVEKTATGFELLGTPAGLEQLGGIDFDEAVFDRVVSELPDVAASLLPEVLTRLRRDCVEVKEALSTDVTAVASTVHDGRSYSVRVTRSEFEQMIHPALALTMDSTSRALASAGVEPAEVSAFVLVGGSSRIPLVAETLMAEFRRPIAQDTHPKHDIVLGATLLVPSRAPGPEPAEPVELEPAGGRTARLRDRLRDRTPGRRPRVLIGVAAAAALALAGTASWVVLGADRSSAAGVEQNALQHEESVTATASGLPTPTPSLTPTASPTPTPTASPTLTAASTTQPPSSAPAVPRPAGMDAATAEFLTTVCAASDDMNAKRIPAGTGFPSLTGMQEAYVLSFAGRASVAQQAAADLAGMLPAVIAYGRIDPAVTAVNMRTLAQVLGDGAVSLQTLEPRTPQDVDAAAAEINRRTAAVPNLSLSVLTPDEFAWVQTLRGCDQLG